MHPSKVDRTQLRELTDLPNVGKETARDLLLLGITSPSQLEGRDPVALYDELCEKTRTRQDPCVLDVFISLTRFMEGEAPQAWWAYTAGRKRMLAAFATSEVSRETPPEERYGGDFDGLMFRYSGVGGWHFVSVPDHLSPPATHAWGRTPIVATVDGHTWRTSVWRGKDGRTLLAIPKQARHGKGDGDVVHVKVSFNTL